MIQFWCRVMAHVNNTEIYDLQYIYLSFIQEFEIWGHFKALFQATTEHNHWAPNTRFTQTLPNTRLWIRKSVGVKFSAPYSGCNSLKQLTPSVLNQIFTLNKPVVYIHVSDLKQACYLINLKWIISSRCVTRILSIIRWNVVEALNNLNRRMAKWREKGFFPPCDVGATGICQYPRGKIQRWIKPRRA